MVAIIPPGRTGLSSGRWAGAFAVGLLLGGGWQPAALVGQSPAERVEGLVRAADIAWREGRFAEARTGYQGAVGIDSVGSSHAVYRLAVLLSWDGVLARAIPLFQRYIRLEPRDEEGRIALARAYAWNGQTVSSVAVYDSILARDRAYRDAVLGAALALGWAGRFAESVARYDQWLVTNPKDVEAELARARALAWWGKLAESERTYAAIAERGEGLEGHKGVALVAAWRGDLGRSEDIWRRVTRQAPNDAEGWVGLAQVLRWSNRPDDARDALNTALAANPKNQDAAQQLRWVRADLAPAFEPGGLVAWDSDENRSVLASAAVSVRPFRRGRLTIGGSRRDADLGLATGSSTSGRAALRLHVGRALTLVGDGGVVHTAGRLDAVSRDRTVATGGVAATIQLGPRVSLGGNVHKSVFDENAALIRSGIDVRSLGAEGSFRLASRLTLAGGAERASLRGGSAPNERRSGFAALRWRARRTVTWSLGGRAFGYDRNPRDGYFAPSRYQLGEVAGRWAPGRDLGWGAVVEGALGAQRVTFTEAPATTGTQRVSLGVVYRPSPGSEVGADYTFSNVSATAAGPIGGSIYRSQSLNLRVRLVW